MDDRHLISIVFAIIAIIVLMALCVTPGLVGDTINTQQEATTFETKDSQTEKETTEGVSEKDTQNESETQKETTSPTIDQRTFETIDLSKMNIAIDGGLSKLEAKAGQEVNVSIKIINNVKVNSIKITISLGKRLQASTDASGDPKVYFEFPAGPNNTGITSAVCNTNKNRILVNWVSFLDPIEEKDFTFVTFKVKVPDDAKNGEFLPITASITSDDIFDDDYNNIEYKLINGGIDVIG